MRSGPVMMARAMETRRRMPPESSEGNLSMACSSSTNLSASSTRLCDSSSGDAFFVEAVGDVVFDVEGVEEGGLLEDHADVGAEFVEVALGHGGDLLAEDADGAGVGAEEAVGELQQDGFAAAGGAEDDAGSRRARR